MRWSTTWTTLRQYSVINTVVQPPTHRVNEGRATQRRVTLGRARLGVRVGAEGFVDESPSFRQWLTLVPCCAHEQEAHSHSTAYWQHVRPNSTQSEWGGTCLSLVSSWATPLTFELGEMRVGVIAFVLAVVAVAVVAVVPDMDRDGILDS